MALTILNTTGPFIQRKKADILDGTYFVGVIDSFSDRLFLKTSVNGTSVIISLKNPTNIWTDSNVEIKEYREVDLSVTVGLKG